jgi:hypothetical protein
MQELAKVTKMLCSTMKLVEEGADLRTLYNEIPGLKDWWEEHKKIDARRKEKAEANKLKALLRKQALSKLCPAEYQALLDL